MRLTRLQGYTYTKMVRQRTEDGGVEISIRNMWSFGSCGFGTCGFGTCSFGRPPFIPRHFYRIYIRLSALLTRIWGEEQRGGHRKVFPPPVPPPPPPPSIRTTFFSVGSVSPSLCVAQPTSDQLPASNASLASRSLLAGETVASNSSLYSRLGCRTHFNVPPQIEGRRRRR